MKKLISLQMIACLSFVLLLFVGCGSDDNTVNDGDVEQENESSEISDGDEDFVVDGDVSEDEQDAEEPEGTTVSGTDFVIEVGKGIVLTPSAVTDDGNFGDGSWQVVENFLTNKDDSNFAYTAEGLELGYGLLSRNVKMVVSDFEMAANNGSLLSKLEGPYETRTSQIMEEEKYIYLYMTDNDVTYYLRMYYDHKSGLGMHVNYDFSTDPTFP